MIRLNRLQYFLSNIVISLFGMYVTAASNLLGAQRTDGWIIVGTVIWYGLVIYTAAARMKDMGSQSKSLVYAVLLTPILVFNYIVGFIYLSIRKSVN